MSEKLSEEVYHALYYYDDGEEQGYDHGEVMLLNNINDEKRIAELIKLQESDNKRIAYQAILILVSWNKKEGFEKLEQFIRERWDRSQNFEPHRIHGEDAVYDKFSDALRISLLNGNSEANLSSLIRKFLKLYSEVFFESNFKDLLMSLETLDFYIPEVEKIMLDALKKDEIPYQSSHLFPVLVKSDHAYFEKYKPAFEDLISLDKRIRYNIDEAETFLQRQ